MTERIDDDQLDREIRRFLVWQAEDVAGAPPASEVVAWVSSRAASSMHRLRLTPRLAWILLAGLLITALAAAAGGGSWWRGDVVAPSPTSASRTPSNGWIAYSTRSHSATMGVSGEILLVQDGFVPRRIAGGDGRLTVCPTFSPDGTRLSFLRGALSPEGTGLGSLGGEELVVLEVGADGVVRELSILKLEAYVRAGCPKWSPDGAAFAVAAASEVVIVRLDGSRSTLAVPDGHPTRFSMSPLAWAPDGTAIALATDAGIWLLPVDGSTARRVWTGSVLSLSFSPDGSRLAFEEQREGVGGLVSVLTPADEGPAIVLGAGSDAVWSPDGAWLAYGEDRIVITGPDLSGRREAGVASAYGFGGWSPDSQRLLQMRDVSGFSWDLIVVGASAATYTDLVPGIGTGSSRNFPSLADVSWQVVYR